MFVDLTGGRRKAVVALGAGLGVVFVVGLVVVLFGLLNSSPVPLPGWPDSVQRGAEVAPQAPEVSTSPSVQPRTSPTRVTTTPTTPEPTRSRGNGNGHGGRPSKTPGRP